MEDKPHISLKADKIFEIFDFPITNSILAVLIVLIIFLLLAVNYFFESKKQPNKRSNIYYLFNFILKSLYKFFYSVLGEETIKYFPVLASFFLFILLQNWFGLLPGVGSILIKIVGHHEEHHLVPLLRGGTADLNTTLALGFLSVMISNIISIRALGFKNYVARFYRIKEPISFFIGTLEIVSEFSKMISFSFRLFGNIFAGEVLLGVIAFLIPLLVSFPFLILELFVGFIQALVFTMLTCVFISLGISKNH